jgi:transposase-like protein
VIRQETSEDWSVHLFSHLSNFEPPQLKSDLRTGAATVQVGSTRVDLQHEADELCTELVTRYTAGETVKALAARHGMHHQTVRAILVRAGAVVRTRQRLEDAAIDEIVRLYESGATTSEIGERFGVYASTIGRQLQKRGIDRRPPARRRSP